MDSDAFLMPLVGVAGISLGVVATILLSRMKSTKKKGSGYISQESETMTVLDDAVDLHELRILRSLFREPKGRRLESFKDKFYRPFLDATIEKGWVKQTGRRYILTVDGGEVCRAYLKQLLDEWKPTE